MSSTYPRGVALALADAEANVEGDIDVASVADIHETPVSSGEETEV